MYLFTKLEKFFQRFQTKERFVSVNEANITSGNTFNGAHFRT